MKSPHLNESEQRHPFFHDALADDRVQAVRGHDININAKHIPEFSF